MEADKYFDTSTETFHNCEAKMFARESEPDGGAAKKQEAQATQAAVALRKTRHCERKSRKKVTFHMCSLRCRTGVVKVIREVEGCSWDGLLVGESWQTRKG